MNFLDFHNSVEYDLRQESEYMDTLSDDDNKPLSKTHAKRIINEKIVELLMMTQARDYAKVVEHKVIIDTKDIELSPNVLLFHATKINGIWREINTLGDINEPIYSLNMTTLHNDNTWKSGDVVEMLITLFPIPIENDDDIVNFPEEHIELLRKAVVLSVASVVNHSLGDGYFAEYKLLLDNYQSGKKIKTKAKMRKKGIPFGNRRR